ncbi:hypothetical protein BDF22DRAFT_23481 [Syncephalis plumigaleata]|nr:hypothetical protein BDF22DRAFT_23481 [Syncephalis plumigaleata]
MLVDGCVYVLVHGYQRSWVSYNFVTRLCDEKREELLQLVLDNVQSNNIVDTLMRCQELVWQLSQREATAGASKSAQWIGQIQPMHDAIQERAVACAAKDFIRWINTDRKLPELLAGWSADLTTRLLDAILALPGNERNKMIYYMEIRKLMNTETKRRHDEGNMATSPVLQSDIVVVTRPLNGNEHINPFANDNSNALPNTSSTSDGSVVIAEISDVNMAALSRFISNCIEYFSRRWPSIVANNGFDWLPGDVIEELADVIGVKKESLVPMTPRKPPSSRNVNARLERARTENSTREKITPTTLEQLDNAMLHRLDKHPCAVVSRTELTLLLILLILLILLQGH